MGFRVANGRATATAAQRLTTSFLGSIIGLIVKRHNGFLLTGLSILSVATHVTSKHGRNKPLHSMTLTLPPAGSGPSRLCNHLPNVLAVNCEPTELDPWGDHTMHGLSHGRTFTVLLVFVVV